MNEYDDQDDQDDLSSSNSFRARSNTWPLNRPDITVPSSSVCIDETLPEIELEDDDLFTTNENWSTGLVDNQDIMSWDPILNAQNQQQQNQQPATIHHHHNHQHQQLQPQQQDGHHQHHHQHHHHHQQAQHQTQPVNQHQHHHHQHQQPPPPIPINQGHHRHQSIHVHNHHPQPHQQHHHRQDLHQHSQNDPFLDAVSNNPNSVMLAPHGVVQLPQHQSQLQQRLSPTQHPTHVQHQTLNSVHCLDQDESSEYHIHQMHHLSLDNNQPSQPHESSHQDHYALTLTSMCIHNQTTNLNDTSYNITAKHHDQNNHHLQPLSSASYDIDQQAEYELKAPIDETLGHVDHQLSRPLHLHHHIQQHPQMINVHSHHPQPHHQLQTTSSSLDNHSGGAQLMSSSLSTSGIGLSEDLEDLDYNQPIESSILESNSTSEEPQQKPRAAKAQSTDEIKQSDSTSNSKTKLNAPRRNAWGNMSYADLISQAINSTSDKRLTLSQIYDWMVQHVPYFKDKGDSNSSAGWKNSVRHNLSLHSRFKRLQNEGTGKSSWWTINPEANIGKCARRRAASMEASKYEKKRGRAKKKAEAIRQGLISYPSLTNSSLNGSTTALGQQDSQAQPFNQFKNSSQTSVKSELPQQQQQSQIESQPPQLQDLDQFADLQPAPVNRPQLQVQTLDHYVIDQPSRQQQQHLQHLQQSDARSCDDPHSHVQDQSIFISQQTSQHQELRYEENNENNKIHQQPQQQQQQQQQPQQYYYPFELSTAL